MNAKKDRVLFCKEVEQILKENNFERYHSPLVGYVSFVKHTERNTLNVNVRNESDQKHCLSVFANLRTPSKTIGNPYSGKVNFHSSQPVLVAIADFEDHILNILKNEL